RWTGPRQNRPTPIFTCPFRGGSSVEPLVAPNGLTPPRWGAQGGWNPSTCTTPGSGPRERFRERNRVQRDVCPRPRPRLGLPFALNRGHFTPWRRAQSANVCSPEENP